VSFFLTDAKRENMLFYPLVTPVAASAKNHGTSCT
jgi:hypothetical protein